GLPAPVERSNARGFRRSCESRGSRKRKQERRLLPAFLSAPGSDHFLIRKSSTFLPFLVSAASQRGCLPRPVQVSLGLAGLRYFGATLPSLRPFLAALRGALATALVARPPNSSAMV